jgi:hypothetical protein
MTAAAAAQRAVLWLQLASGRRRAVEVGIDPADLDRALAKWRQLLEPSRILHTERYPATLHAEPPNPVVGLPELRHDPVAAMAAHLVDQHGISHDTTLWLRDHEGLVGLVGEHDLDHAEHPDPPLGHTHPLRW